MRIGEVSCDTCKFVLKLNGMYDCQIQGRNTQPTACRAYKIDVSALHSEEIRRYW